MALRVVVGILAALRAALIYGEAERLTSQRLEVPAWPAPRRVAWSSGERANLPVTPAA